MAALVIGVLHPGEMGSALGAGLRGGGHDVVWASEGRSAATAARAAAAGLADAGTTAALLRRCDMIVSVCPPHAAADTAERAARFHGVYVDANAISPERARRIGVAIEAAGGRFVDGGIVGPPPRTAGTTRLYLSGRAAGEAAAAFAETPLEAPVISTRIGDASAVKMAYAAWTKGQAALLLTARAIARAEGVEAALMGEWARSQPGLADACAQAARSAAAKGWRWIGEMQEIEATCAAGGLPAGFHAAAGEVFARAPREAAPRPGPDLLERVLAAIGRPAAGP